MILQVAELRAELGLPWANKPYQLISWWEMEKFCAESFYMLASVIETIAIHGRSHKADEIVPQDRAEYDSEHVRIVAEDCAKIGLSLSAKYAIGFADKLKEQITFGERSTCFDVLQGRIADEMGMQLFLHIPSDRAAYYDQRELFGKEVNDAFPETQFDIVEAGNCYAAGRGTACVFHLMRIMEIGTQRLGSKLGVTLVHEKNWQNILDEINKAIKALPKGPGTVEMAQASANLYAVKLAWRNEVMHPKETYTLEEAENLVKQVRIFMQQLAKIIP